MHFVSSCSQSRSNFSDDEYLLYYITLRYVTFITLQYITITLQGSEGSAHTMSTMQHQCNVHGAMFTAQCSRRNVIFDEIC